MKRRVLIFTVDLVPCPGLPTYGGGLRTWGLGQALAGAGHDVVYSVPAELLAGKTGVPAEISKNAFEANRLQDIINENEPDVLLFEQWGLLEYLEEDGIATAVDLHGSLILENSYRGQLNWALNAEAKIRALRKVDFVITPGHRQADYFKPWLMLAGENPKGLPIAVVPVSLPPALPARKKQKKPAEPTFVQGGNLWPWIDPLPALEVVARTLDKKKKGRLELFTGQPVRHSVLPQEPPGVEDTSPRLAGVLKHRRVTEHGFMSRDELLERFAGAHVAVDVYRKNAERELAITTRTLEYMWAGLPVLYADYAELSPIIAGAGAGWTVEPDDCAAIERIVESVLADPTVAETKGANARKLVSERFTWDKTIAPLEAFVSDPVRRGKGRAIFAQLNAEFEGLRREWDGQRESLQNTLTELSRENTRLGKQYADLEQAYQAHHRELRTKSDELVRVGEKIDAEVKWRDEEIRRLTREKADECKWRDDDIRRKDVQAAEAAARHQAELSERDQENRRLAREMAEEIRRRDEKYEALNDRLNEDIRKRDEELRMLALERARDIRDLNEQISIREQKLNDAATDLRGIVLERDGLERKATEAAASAAQLEKDVEAGREHLLVEVGKVETERARLQTELERLSEDLAEAHEKHFELLVERDALARLSTDRLSELHRLEKELEDTRTSDRAELAKVEAERARLQLSLQTVGEELSASSKLVTETRLACDDLHAKLAAERNAQARMREEIERERSAFVQERDGLRQSLAAVSTEAERQRRHAADLDAGIAARDERIRWLEGVLFSMKNRLPHKLYKAGTYWVKRVAVQYPLLATLYLVNFLSNLYMHWWTQRHQQQVFPGM